MIPGGYPSIAWFVLLVALAAAVQVAVAWCLRLWFGRHDQQSPVQLSLDHHSVSQIVARLHVMAGHVAAKADGHCSEISAQSQELKAAADHSPETVRQVVFQVADQIVESNGQLQDQLKTAIQRLEDQAEYIRSQSNEARTDSLTGLSNRRAFDELLACRHSEWERTATPLSLIMLDIDHFKRCNDTYGHPAGDAVLRMVSACLLECVRDMDMVARYGGEELVVILPTAQLDAALDIAGRIRSSIEQCCCRHEQHEIRVTASLGVAEARAGEVVAKFVGRADTALYAAKKAGRNCCWYHDGQTSRSDDMENSAPSAPSSAAAQWVELQGDLRRRIGELAVETEA